MVAYGCEPVEHTADIGIAVWGDSKEELFVAAGLGLCGLMYDIEAVIPDESREIKAAGYDDESLLIAWLDELIYIFEVGRFMFHGLVVNQLDERNLVASGNGQHFDPGKHSGLREVKAATLHMLKIIKNNKWHAQVIFDV